LESEEFKGSIQGFIISEQINWHFIPTKSLHFDGIWEAAVHFIKLLKCMIGEICFTEAEMIIILIQVEAT